MKIYKRDIQHDYTYQQLSSIEDYYNLERTETEEHFAIGRQIIVFEDSKGETVLTFLLTGYSNQSIWTLVWISDIFDLL